MLLATFLLRPVSYLFFAMWFSVNGRMYRNRKVEGAVREGEQESLSVTEHPIDLRESDQKCVARTVRLLRDPYRLLDNARRADSVSV